MNNTTNVFKSRGTQYTEDFSDSEDAWEHAISSDPRIIAALHGMSDDERAEAADEFGEGFAEATDAKTPAPSYKLIDPHNEAGWQETSRQEDGKMLYANGVKSRYQSAWLDDKWFELGQPDVMFVSPWNTGDVQLEGWAKEDYPHLLPPADDVDAEKQNELALAASAFTGDDGYDWLTDGADNAYLAGLDTEGVKAYVLDYGDIIWGGDAHLPRFEELTVSEFFEAADYDAAVAAVTEAVKNAQGRTKENKIVKFLSGNIQIDVDLKNPPLVEGGIPAPRTWSEVLADDTNDGRGYDVDYTPFSSLGWTFNAANVCRAEKNGTYATRGEAWLVSEAFNTIEAKRQRRLQG